MTSQPNMGNKYPPQRQQLGNKYPIQSNQSNNKSNQNTFTAGTQITVNKLNDIYRRDAHTSSSSRLRSYNNRYITIDSQVINNHPSGAGLANNRAKWRAMQTNTILQLNKVGNKYPSTTSKKLST